MLVSVFNCTNHYQACGTVSQTCWKLTAPRSASRARYLATSSVVGVTWRPGSWPCSASRYGICKDRYKILFRHFSLRAARRPWSFCWRPGSLSNTWGCTPPSGGAGPGTWTAGSTVSSWRCPATTLSCSPSIRPGHVFPLLQILSQVPLLAQERKGYEARTTNICKATYRLIRFY